MTWCVHHLMRRWLVGVSLVIHIAVIFGLFVAGMWRIDALDPVKHRIDIAQQLAPPAASEGGPHAAKQPIVPKQPPRVIVHVPVQPEPRDTVTAPAITGDEPGDGSGIGSGSGSGTDDGPCVSDCGPGSAAAAPIPAKEPTTPTLVAPLVLRGLRISGETQIQPNSVVKSTMMNDGKAQVTAMVKVCLDARGDVGSASLLRSSGYASYDADLLAAVRAWRYRPYLLNNVGIPVCGVVTFIYAMK